MKTIGAGTTPLRLLRKAVGMTNWPVGTKGTLAKASSWISTASFFCAARSGASIHWARIASSFSSLGQPNHAFSPLAQGGIEGGIDHVGADEPGEEDAPAVLVDRVFDGAPVDERAPIHSLKIDIEADLAQLFGDDLGLCIDDRLVSGGDQHDALAVVAALLDQRLCLLDIALAFERLRAGLARHRRAAG